MFTTIHSDFINNTYLQIFSFLDIQISIVINIQTNFRE